MSTPKGKKGKNVSVMMKGEDKIFHLFIDAGTMVKIQVMHSNVYTPPKVPSRSSK